MVEEVFRDVFAQEVEIHIGGRQIRVKEPAIIRLDGKDILFLYGDVGKHGVSDDKLFKELRGHQYQESMSETIKRVTPRAVKQTRFCVGKAKPSKRRARLIRGVRAIGSASPVS